MAFVDEFIGNLRGTQNIARGLVSPKAQPKTESKSQVDKTSPLYSSLIDKPTNPVGQMPTSDRYVKPNESVEGTNRYVFRQPSVSPEQYYNFLDTKDMFSEMIDKWAQEDSPQKRVDIVRQYAGQYGFQNNNVYKNMLEDLARYDYASEYHPEEAPDAFTPQGRKKWQDAFENNLKAAQELFDPAVRQPRA